MCERSWILLTGQLVNVLLWWKSELLILHIVSLRHASSTATATSSTHARARAADGTVFRTGGATITTTHGAPEIAN